MPLSTELTDHIKKSSWKSYYKKKQDCEFSNAHYFFINSVRKARALPHVLDLGGGSGVDSDFFLKNGLKVTVVEPCVDSVPYIDRLIKEYGTKKIFFYNCGIEELNVNANVFDAIWCSFVIPFVNIDIVRNIFSSDGLILKSLKEGGEMHLTFFCKEDGRTDGLTVYTGKEAPKVGCHLEKLFCESFNTTQPLLRKEKKQESEGMTLTDVGCYFLVCRKIGDNIFIEKVDGYNIKS